MTKEQRIKAQSKTAATTAVAEPELDPLHDIIGEPIVDTPPASEPASLPIDNDAAEVIVPLGQLHEGYLSNHVEARLTSDRQKRNMRRMLQGLRTDGAKLENGRFVETPADAVRWVLEQLG